MRLPCLAAAVALCLGAPAGASVAQQVGDTLFRPALADPAFPGGGGPVVLVDAAHGNFHTAGGRYRPFARLLERDGWTVRSLRGPATPEALAGARVVVIANALDSSNLGRWALPVRQAFSPPERAALQGFVYGGGALLLIADHMPFPGAVDSLAAVFGVEMINGFVLPEPRGGAYTFRATDGSLAPHPATRGLDSVRSFTGQGMRITGVGTPLLTFRDDAVMLIPTEAWRFHDDTPRFAAAGLYQGVLVEYGRGRAALFGEAAMFTAQRAGPDRTPMGMNAPGAAQNARLLQGVMRWLIGREGQ